LVLPPYSPKLPTLPNYNPLNASGDLPMPLVNRCFDAPSDLEDVLEARCPMLLFRQAEVKALTHSHGWPA